MKSIILSTLFICAFTLSSFAAKNNTFSDFFQKYKDSEECVSVNIPGLLFQLIVKDEEHGDLTKGISNMKLLILDDISDKNRKMKSEIKKFLPNKLYKDLMIIQDGQEKIILKYREINKNKSEIILLIDDEDSLLTLSISGKIDEESAKKIMDSIDVNDIKKNGRQKGN